MTASENELRVLEFLERLNIPTVRHEHPPVATVEEAEKHWAGLRATHCKNLFLRNYKGNRHFLVIAPATKRIDLKLLTGLLGEDRLSFASPDRLKNYLGLEPGSVSPFGLINDPRKDVRVVLDDELRAAAALGFHPNVNTATLEIALADFERFLSACGQDVRWLKF